MAATLCDLPPEAMDEMDAADFAAISEVLGRFFAQGPGVSDWRGVVADTAHVLSTPVTAFDDMDWAEVLLWHAEARRLSGQARQS